MKMSRPFFLILTMVLGVSSCSLFNNSDQVTGFSASQGEGATVSLSWGGPTDGNGDSIDVDHYVLSRSPTNFGSGDVITTATSYSDSSIDYTAPIIYTYSIYAVLTAGGTTPTQTAKGYGLVTEKLFWYSTFKTVPIPSNGWLKTMVSPELASQFRLANCGLEIYSVEDFDPSSPSWVASDPGAAVTTFNFKTSKTKYIYIKVLPGASPVLEARYR